MSNQITSLNGDFIHFNPPADAKSFGTIQATAVASLANNPKIKSSINFNVTTLGSVTPVIADQVYTQGA